MNITPEYKTDGDDLLTYLLFSASKSESIKKRRRKAVIRVPFVYLLFGILGLLIHAYGLSMAFCLFALGWYFIYPLYQRKYYIKHYKNWIRDTYKSGFDGVTTIQLSDEFLIFKSAVSETKILTSQFTEINEIASYIFVQLINGGRWIVPKEKIENVELVKKELKELATKLNIPYNVDYDWKWK